ncbi:MAG: hypothetical protein A2341_24920 [Deltaproteobacteria bacterium RIFOXYB12_FULL_58_9]|nr:MAG: hypothetical protein A2341_24920 [Deltaproteobacteria bacterium RIFOXYB12_FULL_58_9]
MHEIRAEEVTQSLYLGADIGGTRSRVWVVSAAGEVLGRAEGIGANYQCVGPRVAEERISAVVGSALGVAGVAIGDVEAACFGIAGADRPKDYQAIQRQLPPFRNAPLLVNDSVIALGAGTPAGVGAAMVAGTGTNTVGRDALGRLEFVGGYGSELGDSGSANDIGREALGLAMRGRDGRGEPTVLWDKLCAALGVPVLEDIIDLWMAGDFQDSHYGRLAPCVFEAAGEGDAVARALLQRAGDEFALCLRIVLDRLFSRDEIVHVVLGGSVLQKGDDRTLIRAVVTKLRQSYPRVRVARLRVEPIVGAVMLAYDHGRDESVRVQHAATRDPSGGGNIATVSPSRASVEETMARENFVAGLEKSVGVSPFAELIDCD